MAGRLRAFIGFLLSFLKRMVSGACEALLMTAHEVTESSE